MVSNNQPALKTLKFKAIGTTHLQRYRICEITYVYFYKRQKLYLSFALEWHPLLIRHTTDVH